MWARALLARPSSANLPLIASHARRCFSVSSAARASSENKLDLSGVIPPIPTPFDVNGKLAFEKLESNFRLWSRAPFKGYLVEGSNGEYVLMTDQERVDLVKRARQHIPNEQFLLAGSGCSSTAATIEMTQKMADVGADAVMVVTPGYYKTSMNDDAMVRFFEQVADKSPVPVVLYSMPLYAGVDLSVQAVTKLCEHDNIFGMKDSGGDVAKYALMVHLTRKVLGNDSFQIVAGSASVLVQALSVGCVGVVSAIGNILGKDLCMVVELAKSGRWEEAAELNRRLIQPNAAITSQFGVPGLKAAMDQYGYYGGPPREPLLPLKGEAVEKILKAFADNGF